VSRRCSCRENSIHVSTEFISMYVCMYLCIHRYLQAAPSRAQDAGMLLCRLLLQRVIQCVAVCCSVLQCVAVYYSVYSSVTLLCHGRVLLQPEPVEYMQIQTYIYMYVFVNMWVWISKQESVQHQGVWDRWVRVRKIHPLILLPLSLKDTSQNRQGT